MNRPYVVCHIFSALDGGIVGNYMFMPETAKAREQYGKLRQTFNCTAMLYGTTTMLEFCGGYAEKLDDCPHVPREDFISSEAKGEFVVALDCLGELAYSKNYLERHGSRFHIIEVLTEKASNAYINYLKKLNISYIFAGKSELDCALAMQKLKEKFGIERLMIAGGGYTDWTFADAGMIDELSLVLAPAADGENQVTVFERGKSAKEDAIAFTLTDVQKLDGNAVWLRYQVNNRKK